jgi:hypothetical protein
MPCEKRWQTSALSERILYSRHHGAPKCPRHVPRLRSGHKPFLYGEYMDAPRSSDWRHHS